VTEIPEHLLNRSKARRAAASGESTGESTGDASPAVAASATPAAAAPAKKNVAPAPKAAIPDPVYVTAAKNRRKIPFWAMSALALLPVWALIYFIAVVPEEKVVEGPTSIGTAVYSSCAGCHGANGAGGAGQVLYEGNAIKTFPHIEDMLNFVYAGSQKYVAAGLATYGDPNREGGAHKPLGYNGNPMPQQGEKAGGGLNEAQILAVVCHIRYDLAGADPKSEEWAAEYETWCSPDSEIYKALESGSTSFDTIEKDFSMLDPKPIAVGTDPRLGTSK
jgi:mono/diheme cytochrome c family protein